MLILKKILYLTKDSILDKKIYLLQEIRFLTKVLFLIKGLFWQNFLFFKKDSIWYKVRFFVGFLLNIPFLTQFYISQNRFNLTQISILFFTKYLIFDKNLDPQKGYCNSSYLPHNRGFDTHYGHYAGSMDYDSHSISNNFRHHINHYMNGEPEKVEN